MVNNSPSPSLSARATNIPQAPGWYRKNVDTVRGQMNALLNTHFLEYLLCFLWDSELSVKVYICLELFWDKRANIITNQEWKDLQLLFHFLWKRVINGMMQWQSENKETTDYTLIHDIIHSCVRYMKDPENLSKDPQRFVPTPFKHPASKLPNNRESLEEEVFALLWRNNIIRGFLTLKRQEESWENRNNLLSWSTLKEQFILNYPEYAFEKYADFDFYSNYRATDYPWKSEDTVRQEYTSMRNSITTHMHPKLAELLSYIWDHRDNPRVMVDLFFREMQPLIDQIKKRKPR